MEIFDIKFCMSNEEFRELGIGIIEQNKTPDGMLYDPNYDEYITIDKACMIIDNMVDLANKMNYTIIDIHQDVNTAIDFSKKLSKRIFDNGLISRETYDKYNNKMDEVIELYKSTLS